MPHWSYYGPPHWTVNQMTDCKWDGKQESWYGSDLYVGELSGLSRFAASLMGFMTGSMNESDHWTLYENLYTGDTLESLLSIGRKNAFYHTIFSILLCLVVLPVYISAIALWRKFKKPVPKSKDQIAWLWLAQIPLFILTLSVGVLFTFPIWSSHSTIQSNDNARFAIDKIKSMEDQQLWMGQCELDGLENKLTNFKHEINELIANYSQADCSTEEFLKRRMDFITSDLETVTEAGQQIALLKNQLEDLIEAKQPSLEKEMLNRTLGVLLKQENTLRKLEKALIDTEAKVAGHYNRTLAEKSRIKAKSQNAVNTYEMTMDKTFDSFKKVKDSLDNAVKKLALFTTTVSQRFQRIQKEIHERDPLALYVFMQVVVATGAITSMICLGLGFIVLMCLPIFPKAPLTNFARKVLVFGFGLLVVASFFCFIFAAIIMAYTVPITSVCSTLTNVGEYGSPGPAVDFHETIGTKLSLTTAAGREIPISFGRFITATGYESLASRKGNQYEDLFHPEDHTSMDKWMDFRDQRMPVFNLDEINIPAQPEMQRIVKQLISDLRSESVNVGSPEVREVRHEVKILQDLFMQMDLSPFEELHLPKCRQQFGTAHDSTKFRNSVSQALESYQNVMMTELHYQATKFAYIYLGGAPGDLCVELRVPLSGMWLVLVLLGGLLVVNMVVIRNIAEYLKFEENEQLNKNAEKEPLFTADLAAPLLSQETGEK